MLFGSFDFIALNYTTLSTDRNNRKDFSQPVTPPCIFFSSCFILFTLRSTHRLYLLLLFTFKKSASSCSTCRLFNIISYSPQRSAHTWGQVSAATIARATDKSRGKVISCELTIFIKIPSRRDEHFSLFNCFHEFRLV